MKNKKMKTIKYESEDTKEIKNLIFIILGIVIIIAGLYFLTARSINRKNTLPEAEFDYTVCTVGTMFNRPYDEYYVFLYSSEDENSSKYNELVKAYTKKEDALKIYTVDLNTNLDSKYLSDKSNNNPTSPSEVKIKDSALIKIKNGKVSEYHETTTDYEKVLK